MSLLYYVTGHGFGHAVRSAEVMRALLRQAPGLRLLVRSTAPAWLFPPGVEHTPLEADVGLVQRDSLEHDEQRTLERLRLHLEALPRLAEGEAALARQARVGAVVGDIPPLAFEVAARLEVPGLAVGNFAWDEIYHGLEPALPAFGPLIERVVAVYHHATLLLRLPFHLPMSAFPHVEDVPLVARRATLPRQETRARLGIAADASVVLLSFGGFDLEGFDMAPLARLPQHTFVATPREIVGAVPGNVVRVERQQANYTDLVAASDVVVTKPGYGIVSDCLANQVPVVYTDRADFPEYPVLAEALERLGRAAHIAQAALRQGDLGPALASVLAQDRPWAPLRLDGAEVVASRVLGYLAGQSAESTVSS